MSGETLPLAPQGVFLTIQGEGELMGEPMVFVRLAGCGVNCDGCDTDYSFAERLSVREIVARAVSVQRSARWVWVTGGEPTIHELRPLVKELRKYGFRVALATAGERDVERGFAKHLDGGVVQQNDGFEFVSVSPHRLDKWTLRRGDQLNIVPGLNGLRLADIEGVDVSGFNHRFVTPCWYGATDRMEKVQECVEWVHTHPGWRLGCQSHKFWNLA